MDRPPAGLISVLAIAVAAAPAVVAAPWGPVVVVGLDSATWSVMDPLIAGGELPTFRRLRDEGVSGELHTLVPTFSPTIWTTMMTGVTPRLHGIQTPAPKEEMPQTSDCRRVAAIWDMAGEHCLRSNVLNLWCTWPAEPIRGNMVTERTTWRLPGIASPDSILPLVGGILPAPGPTHVRTMRHAPALREDAMVELALALQAFDPADFVMLYFRELDVVQHRAWSSWPPAGEAHEGPSEGEIPAAYRRYDAILARIDAALPPEATLIVVSDHGMEGVDESTTSRLFDANVVLRALGLLELDAGGNADRARSAAIAVRSAPGDRIAVQLTGLRPLADVRARILGATLADAPLFRVVRESPAQLVLEAPGVVSAPATAMVACPPGGGAGASPGGGTVRLPLARLFSQSTAATGEHDGAPPGIVILHGAAVRGRGLRLSRASVVDIGPTILALLGVPLPVGCEGRILEDGLRAEVVAAARLLEPTLYRRPPPVPSRLPREIARSDEEQLRALGYLN